MADVVLAGVSKKYGAVGVIHDISLAIEDGEFVVFVGPSGCGKSTLLRMVAGFETITGGNVLIGGNRVNDIAARDRGVAMVFQNYALYPHMTARENMAFGLRNIGTPKAEIVSRIGKAAAILQLEPYLDRKPKALSGGQRQRVAIGRAIMREPDVFLFDEPLSNLDAALRVSMRTEIAKLHHRLGATMIYVTHDQTEAMTMADRIVVLRDGNIEQAGAPIELYNRPANAFVAGFLGAPHINLIPATVTSVEGETAELACAGNARIIAKVRTRPAEGDKVTLGLRPEILSPADEGPLSGVVDVVEQLGSVQLVYATLANGTSIVSELRGGVAPSIGSVARFAIGQGTRHVFDAAEASITLHSGGGA
ncbi:sn-glycerol-3-phosphate ABC transporter ATP-binding protein UgpC [Rhizobium redzepovicii]|uniref:Sn-glycerol-3-phosphate ABC transporter ATP-binding protein UgpC n=1 Tax=Rhizobium redzepovicii TaxID=2867518 RepID=A0AAW8P762_9HYPH|nr:sn-glycerol-3-phosphate ABC transporter ATP-binding protein UgpC [Rhizobium redzepovicii]MDR9762894.1 sn-glycerol-3-phosphate ABC transporter ATP-binding protein UgpC [Rhizobium redzepovicii]